MAPRTVLGPGYTGWCLACPEAAVAGTGGRSRTPRGGSRRARRTAIPLCNEPSSLSRHDGSHRAPHLKPCGRRGQHVAGMLSPAGCRQGSRAAVAGGCRARALWGMSCGGEARRSDRGWSSGTCDRSRERRVQLARRKGLTVQVANVLPLAGLPWRRRRAAARASCFRLRDCKARTLYAIHGGVVRVTAAE